MSYGEIFFFKLQSNDIEVYKWSLNNFYNEWMKFNYNLDYSTTQKISCTSNEFPLEIKINDQQVITFDKHTLNIIHNRVERLYLIFESIRTDNVSTLEKLLSPNPDYNMDLELYGWTPLHVAVENKSLKVINYLISNGVNVNRELHHFDGNGRTPLHIATWATNYNIIKLLLENNADVNAYEACKGAPIMVAVRRENIGIISFFLENGADINCCIYEGPDEGKTLLHFAAQGFECDTLKYLLDQGISNISAVTSKNETALHIAMKNYKINKSTIQLLLDAGVDVNVENCDGMLAVDFARPENKNLQAGALIKQHIVKLIQADIGNVSNRNKAKVKNNKFDDLRVLCSREVDIMTKVRLGYTAVTFYDLMSKSIDELALDLMCIRSISGFIMPRESSLFPRYQDMINRRVMTIKQQIDLMRAN